MKQAKLLLALSLVGLTLASCEGTQNPVTPPTNGTDTITTNSESQKDSLLRVAMTPYVDNTVVPTYRSLADATTELYEKCETMFAHFEVGALTEADVRAAADEWEKARKYWELSEAFLFGPAANHNIDPHIDSWPLDKDAMDAMLGNEGQMKQIEDLGADYVGNALGYGLLGFHAVEYMLYDSENKDKNNVRLHALNYTRAELVYLVAVAEDLRNQTITLEASWAGVDNISAEKQAILEEAEIEYGDFSRGYGSYMKEATGGIYPTYQAAAEELIQGCIDIADEVGNTKIGRPAHATSDEDRNYIESPYSLNSIEDFQDNIRSIQNSYIGSNAGDASVSDFIKQVNPDLDARCRQAIEDAITAIATIPEPFIETAKGGAAENAVKVVGTDLVDVLTDVYNALSEDLD